MKERKLDRKRREFIRRMLAASVGSAGWLGFGAGMQLATAALKESSALPAYRALVCIYLDGGNDSYNMLVPTDTAAYNAYSTSRTNLAIGRNQLHTLNGTPHGLHPAMPRLASLYNQGRVAFVNNVGTLIQPVTKAQVLAGSAPLPPQLFSHSDQQKQWELTAANSLGAEGWLGRAADLLASQNSTLIPMNITLDDIRVLQTGSSQPYALSAWGLEDFTHRRRWPDQDLRHQTYQALLQQTYSHPLMQAFAGLHRDALAIYDELAADLAVAPSVPNTADYPSGAYLADQLQMVAKVIASQAAKPTVNRQIFMVRMGGHDLHDYLLTGQQELLGILDQCIQAFLNTLASPGWSGLADKVTLFTVSEFARTLSSNGDGSDHAWGGIQFVVGDAVQGGMYGSYPDLTLGSSLDIDDRAGRLIPTLAVEQYAATLLRWMGLNDADLAAIFPNLGNFSSNDLGFML